MKPTEMVRHAEEQGWRAEQTKKGWMLKSPDGIAQVLIHGTPRTRTCTGRQSA